MKFVALALALLLAVGSQAASLQSDPVAQLAHARAAADIFLTQVKEGAIRTLSSLDDTEYKASKDLLVLHLNEFHEQLKVLQGSVSPYTDGVVSTVGDLTKEFRANVDTDIAALKSELEPLRANLRKVVLEHLEEYRALLEPVITEFHEAHMVAMKGKVQPLVADLQIKINENVEETKNALIPIVEAVQKKVAARVEDLRSSIKPYVDDYKDQMAKAVEHAKSISSDDITALRHKIEPLVGDIKVKLQAIFENIAETVNKA
ncbi:apolipoprotein A-I-like [Stigmatopora argus]